MATVEHKQHDSRYAKKKRGTPGPNAMHAIAEQGEDGIWRVNGAPYKTPHRHRYLGKYGPSNRDAWEDLETGAIVY